MRIFAFSVLIIFYSLTYAQEDLYEVSISEKVDSSDLIFTGEVFSIESYIDEKTGSICSNNKVLLHTLLKGSPLHDTITIITQGGRVGNKLTITSSLLSLNEGDRGVFMCYEYDDDGRYKVYSSKQGFYKYDKYGQKAFCPFYNSDRSSLLENIQSLTSDKPLEKRIMSFQQYQTKNLGSVSFNPHILTAGTGHVIEIIGSGFGNIGPSATDFVAFSDADNGGAPAFIQPNLSNYLSWSDTLIKVILPSRAGSGPIRVESGGSSMQSTDSLLVPFAIRNASTGESIELIDENSNGGSTWTINGSFFGTSTQDAFERALETWKCNTGVNWDVAPNSTFSWAVADDGVNIVAPAVLPAGVLGQCHTHLTLCNSSTAIVVGQDLVFNQSTNWHFSVSNPNLTEFDFESVALHELGHAHLLAHIIEPEDLMHFSIAPGHTRRSLSDVNKLAGSYVMDISTSSNSCFSNPHVQSYPNGCSPLDVTDTRIISPENKLNDMTCFGSQDIQIDIGNYGPDTLYQMEINWSVNGDVQPVTNWSGALGLNGVENEITLGNYNFTDTNYTVVVWLSNQNGGQELNSEADTIIFNFRPDPCTPDDASVILLNDFDSLGCYNSEPIECRLINKGTNDLDSCWIHYDLGGVTDSLFWTGSLSPEDSTGPIILTNYTQFGAQNSFTVYSKLPNGVSDTYNPNDSVIYTFPLYRLKGVYTVGGANPDFQHPKEAFDYLNDYGICGDVTFNIRDGVYYGRFDLLNFTRDSSHHTVLIQSESLDSTNVTLRSDSVNVLYQTVRMIECSNIRFGHLTLDRHIQGQMRPICKISNAKDISISNCHFGGVNHSTTKENILIGDQSWGGVQYYHENISILNNYFEKGEYGVSAYSINTDSVFIEGMKINNNIFDTILRGDIYVDNATKLEVAYNIFRDPYFGNSTSAGSIEHNHFGIDSLNIHHNDFVLNGNGALVRITSPNSSSDQPALFKNNSLVHLERQNSGNGSIEFKDVRKVEMVNNSIYSSTVINQSSYTTSLIYNKVLDSFEMFNNQLVYDGNGFIMEYVDASNLNNLYSDHNNFYFTEDFMWEDGQPNPLTETLSDYRANTGQDSSSLNIDPQFISIDTLIPTINALNNKGTSWPGVIDDIHNRSRDTLAPDIGAYEFGGPNFDVALDSIFEPSGYNCTAPDSVLSVVVKNNHTDSILESADITYSINGSTITQYNWNGSILPGQSTLDTLGYYPFTSDSTYLIQIGISNPNGLADNDISNDSLIYSYYHNSTSEILGSDSLCDGDSILLTSSVDHNNSSYLWSSGDTTNAIYVSDSGLVTLISSVYGCTTNDSLFINLFPAVNASFSVIDDSILQSDITNASGYQWFLDGQAISGATSATYTASIQGNYTLLVSDSNGCEGLSDAYYFNTANIDEFDKPDYLVIPNPIRNEFKVILPHNESVGLRIYNKFGQLVFDKSNVKSDEPIIIEHLSAGIYFVDIDYLGTKKIAVIR